MNTSEKRGVPVTDVKDLGDWVRSRGVRLSIRWKGKRWSGAKGEYVVDVIIPRRKGYKLRTCNANLAVALSVTVDTVNDHLTGAAT